MKNLLLFAFCFFSLFEKTYSQVPAVMPPDANNFYNNSMPFLRPQVKSLILQTAKAMSHHKANADSLSQSLKTNVYLKGMNSNDIEGVIVLIMVQASKDADTDLKNLVMNINKDGQKQETHSNIQTASTTTNASKDEVIEMQKLKLQKIIDHKSDMAEEVTYVMKKISGTQESIINNLK